MEIVANYLRNGQYEFVAWAPFVNTVSLKIISPYEKIIRMKRDSGKYWKNTIEDLVQNISYFYRLDDERDMPEPAYHYQPNGIHVPSQVIDHCFHWEDGSWKGSDFAKRIIYELHVGTFTPNETVDAVFCHLDELNDLG